MGQVSEGQTKCRYCMEIQKDNDSNNHDLLSTNCTKDFV